MRNQLRYLACTAYLSVWLSGVSLSQLSVPEHDYADELPRIPPTPATEALKTFRIQPGFRLEQVAAEPLIASPVAVAWDEHGRMFVVEMRGYSEDKEQRLSRIRCLTDANQDGVYDDATVFVDDLLWPTAIACWNGGILVADAPDLWFFRDTNHDLQADTKELWFTGFGTNNIQGLVNSLEWHFDQRLYGASSINAGSLRSLNRPDDQPLDLRGRDFSIDLKTRECRAECGGAQHGASFDDWGNRFVCSNSDHLQQVLFEERYLARNPRHVVPATRSSIAVDGPQANVFRISPIEPWRIVRTRLRVAGMVPGPVEGGGRAAGYFTGATGSTVIRGSAFLPELHQQVVIGDAGGNIVHRKKLEPAGTRFRAIRIDEESEFLASSDIWFRPVQFANGPDGGLYVIDMYREVIEHPDSLPPVIKKHLDLTSGRDRGRIYRIVPEGFRSSRTPDLGTMISAELIPLLGHPNYWHRATASRLIYERADTSLAPQLEAYVLDRQTPALGVIWGMYTLQGLAAIRESILLQGLQSSHPAVRRHAIRLAESRIPDSPNLVAALEKLNQDPSVEVRNQLAASWGFARDDDRTANLRQLIRLNCDQPDVLTYCLSSLGQGASDVFLQLLRDRDWRGSPGAGRTLEELISILEFPPHDSPLVEILRELDNLPHEEDRLLARLVCRLMLQIQSAAALPTIGDTRKLLDSLLQRSFQWGSQIVREESEASEDDQILAIRTYAFSPPEQLHALAGRLFKANASHHVKLSLFQTLEGFRDRETGQLLLETLSALTPVEKRTALGLVLRRMEWTDLLLSKIQTGEISPGQLDPVTLNSLRNHPNERLRQMAAACLDSPAAADRESLLRTYQAAAFDRGSPQRGKEVYVRSCSGCHQIQDLGTALGPSLPAIVQRGLDALLLGVLDPNRELNPQFENYVLTTVDGKVLAGMLTAESPQSVSIQAADGAITSIYRSQIDELRGTGKSFMPEGLEQQVDPAAMADLWAYLQNLH